MSGEGAGRLTLRTNAAHISELVQTHSVRRRRYHTTPHHSDSTAVRAQHRTLLTRARAHTVMGLHELPVFSPRLKARIVLRLRRVHFAAVIHPALELSLQTRPSAGSAQAVAAAINKTSASDFICKQAKEEEERDQKKGTLTKRGKEEEIYSFGC
jgi:hypothetical protein